MIPRLGGERKAALIGNYARSLETNAGFVDQLAALAAYHLPLDTLDKYIPSIDAVTSEAVTETALRWRDIGGTHASVSTMGLGFTTIDDHIDYMKRVADTVRHAGL